jgi:hypothetical protein
MVAAEKPATRDHAFGARRDAIEQINGCRIAHAIAGRGK